MSAPVTANSIQEQLQAYRRRKKQEDLTKAAAAISSLPITDEAFPATSSGISSRPITDEAVPASPSGTEKRAGLNRLGQGFYYVERGLFFFTSGIDRVLDGIGGAISDVVLPDHLKTNTRRRGGHLLTDAPEDEAAPLQEVAEPLDDDDDDLDEEDIACCAGDRWRWWVAVAVRVVVWLSLWLLFIRWQFGAVFFLLSGFVLIWCNLRSGPVRAGEVSAYSVFNRDMRRIHGTVTAEQLQREMLLRI